MDGSTDVPVPPPEVIAPVPKPGEGPADHRRGGWRALLGNRRFLLLQASGALSGAGYAVYAVSVLYLAYSISGNLVIAGVVLFIEYGVYSLTFLIAPLVDRARDKRTVLLVCFPLQALTAAFLAEQLAAGTLTVPLLLGAVLVLSILWDFVWTVYMIAPRIVVAKDQLFLADGLSSALGAGYQVAGYAGGGALVYLVGPDGGASAYAVLLVLAALFAIPLALTGAQSEPEPFWESFRRGWQAFRGRAGRAMRQWAMVEVVYGFFAALGPLLITAIAYERFPDPAAVYGILVTAFVLGGALAGVVVGHFNPRRAVGALLVGTPIVAGAVILALAAAPSSVIAIGTLLAVAGAALSVRYSAKYSWVLGVFSPEHLGRMVANVYLFTGVASAVAALTIGLLSASVGLAGVILITGSGLVIAGAVAASLPFVRTLRY